MSVVYVHAATKKEGTTAAQGDAVPSAEAGLTASVNAASAEPQPVWQNSTGDNATGEHACAWTHHSMCMTVARTGNCTLCSPEHCSTASA